MTELWPSIRERPEWIGATPSTPVPPRVRARVFMRDGGLCQHCTRKINAGDKSECDHIVAIACGGENRESNCQTLCSWCHAVKTRGDVREKAVIARKRNKHIGIKSAKQLIPGSKGTRWKKKLNGRTELRQ